MLAIASFICVILNYLVFNIIIKYTGTTNLSRFEI